MHVVARGALIGGVVGAVLAAVRGRGAKPSESAAAGRYAKSIAEGAVAGAAVGFLVDRRLQLRPRVREIAELARERAADLRAA